MNCAGGPWVTVTRRAQSRAGTLPLRITFMRKRPGNGQQKAEDVEITQLKPEVARLKMERDILKKPRPLLRQRFVLELRARYSARP